MKPAGLHNVEAEVVVELVFGPAEDDLGLGLPETQVPLVLRVLSQTRAYRREDAATRQINHSKDRNKLFPGSTINIYKYIYIINLKDSKTRCIRRQA